MRPSEELQYQTYLRLDMMPHMLCPGCGHGIALKSMLRAIDRLALRRDGIVVVSGIGCSGRLTGYVDFCTLHTTHGRPLTFATGLKLARPELTVIVITGDGDGLAIGGNHLIHAARRNVDLTCLLLNNAIYGMTNGQAAPTTPLGAISTTTPRGALEATFDACRLAMGAGATFVARGMTGAPLELDELIARAIQHKGFSFLEILSDCPEFFGRYNRLGRGPEMLNAQRRHSELVDPPLSQKAFVPGFRAAATPPPAQVGLASGVLHEESRPELTEQLQNLIAEQRRALPGTGSGKTGPENEASANGQLAAKGTVDGDGTLLQAAQYQVRIAGAGGQGVILAGLLLAEAAVAAGKNATHAQTYGPESRGGASKADVIVSAGEIDYPYATQLDLLLALTDEACERYVEQLKPGGLLLVDSERVGQRARGDVISHALPIFATARQCLGTTLGANLVALGALVGMTGVVPAEAAESAIAARRLGGSAEPGLRAFRAGLQLAAGNIDGVSHAG